MTKNIQNVENSSGKKKTQKKMKKNIKLDTLFPLKRIMQCSDNKAFHFRHELASITFLEIGLKFQKNTGRI